MVDTNKSHPYAAELSDIKDASRWRFLRTWEGAGGVFEHGGRSWLNFSSNDYLGLSTNPVLAEAVSGAMLAHGCGATASRLMSGTLSIHDALERALAKLTGQDGALVFPSGYQANVGVLTSLAGRGDTIFSDALNHASLIDGARLSKAKIEVYRHGDVSHLASLLEAAPPDGRRIIVTDSVFSMDGDCAPLVELAGLAHAHGAILVVDEAHAIGVWGGGGGLCRHLGVQPDICIGTLGKALGSGGGFVACNEGYRDLFINCARSFIYSTGVSPMNAAAALAAVQLLDARPELGPALLDRVRYFREKLAEACVSTISGETQILPIMVGDDGRVMDMAESLLEAGLIVTGIRPPTVPAGTSRLRLSVTLAHEESMLDDAAEIVGRVVRG